MPPQCNPAELRIEGPGRRQVVARFDGGRMSSDGGAVLLREADRIVGVTAKLASCFTDFRQPGRVEHELEALVAQRVYGLALGYEDLTPKGRLTRLETAFLDLPWQEVRQSVDVKLLAEDGELYVLVRSEGRLLKERGMRRRRLKKLWRRLLELQGQSNSRDQLMLKLGAAKKEAGRAWIQPPSMASVRSARSR